MKARVRIAFEWLDAQKPIKTVKPILSKHRIETWAGYYVSATDVQEALDLHPLFHGEYPCANVSSLLVKPNTKRLENIPEAFTHPNYLISAPSYHYSREEGEVEK